MERLARPYRLLVYAGLLVFTVTIQSTIVHYGPLGFMVLDLGMILVIWTGLSHGSRAGMLMGFFAGLLEDAMSGTCLGTNALAKTLIGGLAGVTGGLVLPNSFVVHILTLSIFNVLNYALMYFLQTVTSPSTPSFSWFACQMLLGVLFTTIAGLIVFRVLLRVRLFRPPRIPEDMVGK